MVIECVQGSRVSRVCVCLANESVRDILSQTGPCPVKVVCCPSCPRVHSAMFPSEVCMYKSGCGYKKHEACMEHSYANNTAGSIHLMGIHLGAG